GTWIILVNRAALLLTLTGFALLAITATADSSRAEPGRTGLKIGKDFASDGWRYVSYLRPDQTPVVFDTWTGKTTKIHKAKGCRPADVGGNRVLLICQAPSPFVDRVVAPRTASVKGGRSIPIPRYRKGESFNAIGRYWLDTNPYCPSPSSCFPSYVYKNWRTGHERGFDATRKNEWGRDPNSRHLKRIHPPFIPEQNSGPYDYGDAFCFRNNLALTDHRGELRLWRSSDDPVLIGRGGFLSFDCSPYQGLTFGRNQVTWVRGRTIHSVNTRTLRSVTRRVKRKGAGVAPVRDGIVIAKPARPGGQTSSYRVRFIGLAG
ncbi:MAG: hypothetical protein WBW62_06420, partial [Solirubrobacterales bacterium]